jgi:predicted nucleic acid-binding protein
VIFLDTSVLIAITQVSHERHELSLELWGKCRQDRAFVSTHTLAEIYNTLTALPPALRLASRNDLLAGEAFLQRLTAIALSPDEYMETLRRTASLGLRGGIVYDAIHLACARKIAAKRIYTWNARHLRMVAPDLADRIVTP